MEVGIGLPTTTPGGTPELLIDYARRAEAAGFASVGVLDRLVYNSYDPLIALAAAAAVTDDLGLVTMIVNAPIRRTVHLAKQAASIDALSGGRLTLGVAIGAREDDYELAGAQWAGRGRTLSDQLAELRDLWEQDTVGPPPATPGGPDLLVGGLSDNTYLRVARYADGYVHGGGPPRAFASAARKANAAWADAGRPGDPQLWAQGYVCLTDVDAGEAYMRDYYAFTGAFAEKIVAGMLTTPTEVRDFVRGYADAGCDHLVLLPATSNPEELDRIADALELGGGTG